MISQLKYVRAQILPQIYLIPKPIHVIPILHLLGEKGWEQWCAAKIVSEEK